MLMLGPHWVYNPSKLARLYPEGIDSPTDPVAKFHENRRAGQYTHYGDQTALLRDSIEKRGGFDPDGWREDWVASMKDYDGYIDGATQETLKSEGASPSNSNDLAGASRIGPILDLDLNLDAAIQAARQQTALTHGHSEVTDAAEFMIRAVVALKEGATFEDAFQTAAAEGSYEALKVNDALKAATDADEHDFIEVGKGMGLTCHTPEAFPLTLYFALRASSGVASAISDNGLAGGDSSARGMLLALLFAARDPDEVKGWIEQHAKEEVTVVPGANRFEIQGPAGPLAGVLEVPEGEIRGYALFAHCFTCGKDFIPGSRISRGLAARGIATLRIDFAGLGKSGGKFSESSFVTNMEDLLAAADWMKQQIEAPTLLIGHSLGGAAVLGAATDLDSVRGVVTIGAPYDPGHVTHLFEDQLETLREEGEAEVELAGRTIHVGRKFLDDLETYSHEDRLESLKGKETLILHAPEDEVVPLVDAGKIYSALAHPKSFIALSGADHLLTHSNDSAYVADVIAAWSSHLFRSDDSSD